MTSCQSMSALPSPSKSSAALTCQLLGTLRAANRADFLVIPSICQIATSPVVKFRHITSLLPSPLKSFLGFLPVVAFLNSIATIFSAVIVTVHLLPMGTSHPVQATNVEPSAGVPVRIT
ncbi:hypothetical protein MBAV_003442 [Candidatus Magnetobacterium bavaricum]|uniref:Uncharacterized protein n=1 Tax=Candidatus Magnetobacterium bavaricum TaxID=29290 RepID=A0A0F3GQY5_9BACT|nr:hypothetical protein MBAV_003442 [Candidatus Magnetobacterium bavaricum]